MQNLKLFNLLNFETKEINNQIESLKESLEAKEAELKNVLKDILVETNPVFEECIVKWAMKNPIEAISYYIAMKNDLKEVYFENDNKHEELFEDSDYDESAVYALINKKTLEVNKFKAYEVAEFYSELSGGKEISINIDFLDNYKLPLMKEEGKYIHDCAWTIEYIAIKDDAYPDSIVDIIENNFIIDEDYSISNEEITLSQKNIDDLLEEYKSELELNYENRRTFAIYKDLKVIGFIELLIRKNDFDTYEMEIITFEIFDKYRRMGNGTKVITLLKEMCNLPICGYCKPDDGIVNFWSQNRAEFECCTNCDEYEECEGDFGCDEPLDYCFYIEY